MQFDYLITSVKFFMQLLFYRNIGRNTKPWFRGLDLGLGLEICGIGLDTAAGLIPITGNPVSHIEYCRRW